MKIGAADGRLTVKLVDGSLVQDVPMANVDSINVFGNSQLSTQLVRECLSAQIPIGYYSEDGHYFGKTSSFQGLDPARQKRQIQLTDDKAFCLAWSKRIVAAKIASSMAMLRSMEGEHRFSDAEMHGMKHSLGALEYAESIDMVLGLEGNAARSYFSCLAKLLNVEFVFTGRRAHPPKDPINSMLSYGYSIFHRGIIGAVERHGLHPYFGFMHKMKRGHAALVSDLIEEFRAPLIDRVILVLANSGEITKEDFQVRSDGAVFMSHGTMKILTNALSAEMNVRKSYFSGYGDRRLYAFHAMLDRKLCGAIEAIEARDASIYQPAIWSLENG